MLDPELFLESRRGDCHGKMPGLVQLSATSHMQACMQWGMATIFGPNLRNNSDKDLSDCNSFQLFLLGDFLFPLGPADPGQRASERSWTRTTRQLCRVQRPPTLFSATSPLSHLSKAPNPEKRPHLLCRLFFSSPKWPTCGGKVCQKVEYVGRKLPHCPGLCTFWLAGLPGAAHQPPFTLSDWENCRKKVTWVKKFGNQSEQNVASVLSRSGEACQQRNGQVILQEGNHCVLVYYRKRKEGVYLKM